MPRLLRTVWRPSKGVHFSQNKFYEKSVSFQKVKFFNFQFFSNEKFLQIKQYSKILQANQKSLLESSFVAAAQKS